MTLNLILTSKDAVYLSGDFRITSIRDQAALPDSYDTQKLIPVIRPDWAALIAYMGIASAPPLMSDMGQWIVEQMDSIPLDGSFSEIWRRLLKLNVWLGRIRGDRRIALSIVGFWNEEPCMILISNFLDLHGRVTEAGPQLRAYLRRCNQTAVHAIGTVRPDIFQRVRLERLLQASSSRRMVPHFIRQAVAGINADVARRSGGWISEECVVAMNYLRDLFSKSKAEWVSFILREHFALSALPRFDQWTLSVNRTLKPIRRSSVCDGICLL